MKPASPRLPKGTARLDYLLATPFRYPPLPHGSRFGGRHEPSLFYAARGVTTVLAESAYYRFVFWQGMREPPPVPLRTQHTLFGARLRARRGYALQLPPFATFREVLASRDDYGPTQQLGRALRDAGADAVEYVSARDAHGGLNVALYTPDGVRVATADVQAGVVVRDAGRGSRLLRARRRWAARLSAVAIHGRRSAAGAGGVISLAAARAASAAASPELFAGLAHRSSSSRHSGSTATKRGTTPNAPSSRSSSP